MFKRLGLLFRARIICIVLLVVIAMGLIGLAVVLEGRRELEKERNLHAVLTVGHAVHLYMLKQNQWPESWDDLLAHTPLEQTEPDFDGLYHWPKDAQELRTRVAIDFDQNLQKLDADHMNHFNGIRPLGPCWELYKEYLRDELLSAVDKVVQKKRDSTHGHPK